ncbi:MAG: DUF971 domain-containing protein [Candidatus Latescibacterota bacterium]|nr:DUF971 domain-containing protein [Candidatus Latescibacterota bacterium]
MLREKKKPRSVELLADEGMLCVRWSDGTQSRYDLNGLRRSCPCALCREAREQGDELSLLSGEAITATAEAQRVDFVGRYGLRIVWGDGHDQGIYTFDFLRQLDDAVA